MTAPRTRVHVVEPREAGGAGRGRRRRPLPWLGNGGPTSLGTPVGPAQSMQCKRPRFFYPNRPRVPRSISRPPQSTAVAAGVLNAARPPEALVVSTVDGHVLTLDVNTADPPHPHPTPSPSRRRAAPQPRVVRPSLLASRACPPRPPCARLGLGLGTHRPPPTAPFRCFHRQVWSGELRGEFTSGGPLVRSHVFKDGSSGGGPENESFELDR